MNRRARIAGRSGFTMSDLVIAVVSLLPAFHVLSTGVDGRACPPLFDDLPSKTIQAKVIVAGSPVPRPFLSLSLSLSRPHLQIVEFQLDQEEDLVKVDESLALSPRIAERLLVGWDLRAGGNGGRGCRNFTFHHRKYLVFLNGTSTAMRNESEEQEDDPYDPDDPDDPDDGSRRVFWANGSPVEHNEQTMRKINNYMNRNYGRLPKVKLFPRRSTLTLIDRGGSSLQLRCNTSGRPTPMVTWYKGQEIISGSNQMIKISKNGAQLTVRRVKVSDSGSYFCKGSNVIGSVISSSIQVTVTRHLQHQQPLDSSLPSTRRPTNPLYTACVDQTYCVNHGTCLVIGNISEPFCECPTEFTGQRCQDRREGGSREVLPPPVVLDSSLRSLVIVGLIQLSLIFIALMVIAYCVIMTRYDNAEGRRLSRWVDDGGLMGEAEVRANGALLRSLQGLQQQQQQLDKQQMKLCSNGGGGGGGGGGVGGVGVVVGDDDGGRMVGLPQVLVTLIEEDNRSIPAKSEHPAGTGNGRVSDIRLICPTTVRSTTLPTLTRPRLAAVSTTPSSAASSINLHIDNNNTNDDHHHHHSDN